MSSFKQGEYIDVRQDIETLRLCYDECLSYEPADGKMPCKGISYWDMEPKLCVLYEDCKDAKPSNVHVISAEIDCLNSNSK